MTKRFGASAILFSRSNKGTFYVTVNRNKTRKWMNAIMLGPSETMDPVDNGRMIRTMIRGLKEESNISRPEIRSISPYLMNVEPGRSFVLPDGSPVKGVELPDTVGYTVSFFLVEVPLLVLKRFAREVNAGRHYEWQTAKIHRGLPSLLRATVNNTKLPYIQPHAKVLLDRMKLGKDKWKTVSHKTKRRRTALPYSPHQWKRSKRPL